MILAGKHDSRRHSSAGFTENVVVVEASCQMLEVLSFFLSGKGLTSFNKINRVNFSGENRKTALSRLSIFSEFQKKDFLSLVVVFVLESKGYDTEDILPRFFKSIPFPLLKRETYPRAC